MTDVASLPMTDCLTRLAELSLIGAEIGLEEQARATAAAAYRRGGRFVDVAYFGSSEPEVDGVTVDGERIPVLRHLAWKLGR